MTATTGAVPTNEGRRRQGVGQGNIKMEEDYDRGTRHHHLDTANARAKEAVQRKLKKDTLNTLQLPG